LRIEFPMEPTPAAAFTRFHVSRCVFVSGPLPPGEGVAKRRVRDL
jgi:hypothetical protein